MRASTIKLIVIFLFVLSGICGLIYEVAWSKYLSLFIGNTAYSIMIVLATFMGGLALGAFYWGKFADRTPNRLKLYGILELAIGGYCLFYPLLIGLCEKLFISIAMGLNAASDQMILLLLKFLLSFITLIIPTFFMGGTLPILTKFLTKTIASAGKDVATLYYINSFGAVIGAGLAGFFLIRQYGLDGAITSAAILNLIVGTIALVVASRIKAERVQQEVLSDTAPESVQRYSLHSVRLAIITAALSGFIAMVYELTWTRLLSNIIGSSTYSFSLMLIAFISGITLGSWIVSLIIHKIKNLTSFLGLCQLATALSMIFMLPLYERLPYYLLKISTVMTNKPENFPYFVGFEFLFCFLIMIVPTSLSGMSLPIASRIASADLRVLGRSIGGIFSINTIGTVIGSIVTGLVLIPQFGVKLSIELGVLLNILLGLSIIFMDGKMSLQGRIGIASVVVLLSIGYRVQFPTWDKYIPLSGVYRALFSVNTNSFDELRNDLTKDRKILWYKEGVNANVAVLETKLERGFQKSLIINGKADASTVSDLPTQILLAQIPLMMLPDSGDALVIGLGSGITGGSALQHPIRSLDCVEISSEVVECNSFFESENLYFLKDPRVGLFIDDAITYLKIRPKKYNYIISEPSNPWIAGIGNLFSAEFFNLCKNRLQPGGVLTQWFHTYDMDNEILKLIMRTIKQSFQYVSVWKASDFDILILASENPIAFDFEALEKKMASPSLSKELARILILDVPSLLSTQITPQIHPDALFGDGEINTEKKPLLEFMAPISLFSHSAMTLIDSIDQRFFPSGENLFITEYAVKRPLSTDNFVKIATFRYFMDVGDDRMSYETLKKCLQLSPNNINALFMMSKVSMKYCIVDEGTAVLRKLLSLYPPENQLLSEFFTNLLLTLDDESSIINPEKVNYFMALANTFSDSKRYGEAAGVYRKILDLYINGKISEENGFEEEVTILAAKSLLLNNEIEEAEQFVNQLRQINPQSEQLPMLTTNILEKRKAFAKGEKSTAK